MEDTKKPIVIPVTLKWNKQMFSTYMELGEQSIQFQTRVYGLTGVPKERQKLLAKKNGWKGPLKNDIVLDESVIKEISSTLTVSLIGSSEVLKEPSETTTFVEDLTLQELQQAEEEQAQAALMTAEGMIPALQLPPHRREDHKREMYQYNRLVTGLAQQQIEQELKHGQGTNQGELQGKVAMKMGLELRRAYINDIAVLEDGTCVSVLDDGHVQLWKHGTQQEDTTHPLGVLGAEGGVDSVVSLKRFPSSSIAFVTAGRGSLQLWSTEGSPLISLPGVVPGTSPASLVPILGGCNAFEEASGNAKRISSEDKISVCLATRFEVIREVNPSRFRLPPQNEAERQRRREAEAQEHTIQRSLDQASRNVQLWYSVERRKHHGDNQQPSTASFKYKILEPDSTMGSAPVTSLASMSLNEKQWLIVGDKNGGIRIWNIAVTPRATEDVLEAEEVGFFQFVSSSTLSPTCTIVAMEVLENSRLAVSTDLQSLPVSNLEGTVPIEISEARAVHVFDLSPSLTSLVSMSNAASPPPLPPLSMPPPTLVVSLRGHVHDAVICMCELPNGDMLTGGGKMDATLQLWSQEQIRNPIATVISKSKKRLEEVGYVFALRVLPDRKAGSHYYAVAAGRYNVLKIVI